MEVIFSWYLFQNVLGGSFSQYWNYHSKNVRLLKELMKCFNPHMMIGNRHFILPFHMIPSRRIVLFSN